MTNPSLMWVRGVAVADVAMWIQELHVPFYFTPAKIAGFFHCTTPPLEDVA